MVPRPSFNSLRRTRADETDASGGVANFDLNKPTSVAEALLQGMGRELWVAADALLAASACLTDRVSTQLVVKQTYSALSLARGALALRNSADCLMVMQWQGVPDELERCGIEFMEFVPIKLMEHFAGLFVFFTPLPPSEWAFAADLLKYIGMAFKSTAKKIQDEHLITFRTESADALRRAGQAFIRASSFMGTATEEDTFGRLKLPKDPRKDQGLRGELLTQGFDALSNRLLVEAKEAVRAESKVRDGLDKIHKEVNTHEKQVPRHALLNKLETEYSPYLELEAAVVEEAAPPIITVFVLSAKGLRNADWGGKSDPYCTFEFSDGASKKLQTKVIDDTLNPEWNESFEIEYVPGKHLNFEVYDKDFGPKQDDLLGKATLRNDIFYPRGYDGNLRLTEAGRGVTATMHIAVFVPNAPARSLSQPVPKVDPEKFPLFLFVARIMGYDGLPIAVNFHNIQNHLKTIGSDPKNQDVATAYLAQKEAEFDPARFPGKEGDARHVQSYIRRLRMSDLKRWDFPDVVNTVA